MKVVLVIIYIATFTWLPFSWYLLISEKPLLPNTHSTVLFDL